MDTKLKIIQTKPGVQRPELKHDWTPAVLESDTFKPQIGSFTATRKANIRPYRVSLAVCSYWSSEHPLDAPQLSVTQVGGTDHNVVARHWMELGFMWLNICLFIYFCLDLEKKVLKTAPYPPSSAAPRLLLGLLLNEESITNKEEKWKEARFPSSALIYSLSSPSFCKLLSAHFPISFSLLFNISRSAPPFFPLLPSCLSQISFILFLFEIG